MENSKKVNDQWVKEHEAQIKALSPEKQADLFEKILEYEGLAPISPNTEYEEDLEVAVNSLGEDINRNIEAWEELEQKGKALLEQADRFVHQSKMFFINVQAIYERRVLELPF